MVFVFSAARWNGVLPWRQRQIQSAWILQRRVRQQHPSAVICYLLVYFIYIYIGARCSSVVRWVIGSILHGVDPLSYFSFQPVLHDWCNKGCGMCYPVCRMVHIKEPLLLIVKSSPYGGSGFHLSLSDWLFTICLMPYNHR